MASVPNRMGLLTQKLLDEETDARALAAWCLSIQSTARITYCIRSGSTRINTHQCFSLLHCSAEVHVSWNTA
jgi:hypothetical protein